jgi:hypothetical protein
MAKTIEELEKEKLRAEIDEIKKPFYLKPSFLSIITSSLFAAITIFITLRISNSEELEKIEKRELDLRTKELSLREDSLLVSLDRLEQRIEVLDSEYLLKKELLDKNFMSRSDSLDQLYFFKLKTVESELEFIEKYMNDYANGYAHSFAFLNKATIDTVKKYVPNKQPQFAKWLEKSMRVAILKSNSKNLQKVKLKLEMEEFGLRN